MEVSDTRSFRFVHRDIKYPRVELKTGELVIVLPYGQKPEDILKRNKKWIVQKEGFIKKCLADASKLKIAKRENKEFRKLIESLAKKISYDLCLKINHIYFRKMRTKWASCSLRNNLTVNQLAGYLPEYLLRYIIFHEVTHIRERRHNIRFWNTMKRRFQNYQKLEKDLFAYWFLINKSVKKSD